MAARKLEQSKSLFFSSSCLSPLNKDPVAMSASIGIMGSLAVPILAYLAYAVVRARKGAVPKRWD
jgi:hypothetical protein